MRKIEKEAASLLRKSMSKKELRKLHLSRRLPPVPPGKVHEDKRTEKPRKWRWKGEEE